MTEYQYQVLNDPISNDPSTRHRRADPSVIDIDGYGHVNDLCNDPTDQTLDVVEDGEWVRRIEYTLDD